MLNKKPWLYLAAAAVILLLLKYSDDLLGGIRLFASLLTPLVVGCGIAYVLNIPITRLEALPPLRNPDSRLYPVRRALSIIGSLVIIILVLVLLVLIIIPQLVDAFRVMLVGVPPAVNRFLAWLDSLDVTVPQLESWLRSLNVNWPDLLHGQCFQLRRRAAQQSGRRGDAADHQRHLCPVPAGRQGKAGPAVPSAG